MHVSQPVDSKKKKKLNNFNIKHFNSICLLYTVHFQVQYSKFQHTYLENYNDICRLYS